MSTALVVVWQNSRLAVLWDLSYVLEHAYRISLGDIPYRDFPFPYPPLTFLIQAAIIRLTGRAFWHTIVYCAAMGGIGSILTWRILLNLLREVADCARLLAFILSLPLIVLGIYCVLPHPFYDPDCCLAVLLALLLLQRAERKPSSRLRPVLAGIAVAVPLFVKQNIGLAFFASMLAGIAMLLVFEGLRGQSIRQYVVILLGVLATFTVALVLIQFTAGLKTFWQWTIQFAAARRMPARTEMLEIYEGRSVLLWLSIFMLGLTGGWLLRKRSLWLATVPSLIISLPFAWPAIYLLLDHDPSERAERLVNLWPLVLIISFVIAVVTFNKRRGLQRILPFVVIVTINGAFMSQQLWGSTYAIWPLFVILVADVLASLSILLRDQARTRLVLPLTIALSLLISGGAYVWSHERLDYANLDEGPLSRSSMPALKGLSTRGDWLPNFDELVRYTDREIPRDDAILMIPGEDLFYYTTGRRPLFPVLSFDHTANPYSPDEILKLARERKIRWLIVKQDLQDEDAELEKQRNELTAALEEDFEQVQSLKNYDVYQRTESTDTNK